MHERGVVAEAVARLTAETAGTPAAVVVEVSAATDREAVVAAWRDIVRGTSLAAVPVTWRISVDQLRCFGCGARYGGQPLDTCPDCGGTGLVIEAAPEVAVVDVVVR